MKRSRKALDLVINRLKPVTLLDVGSGDGCFTDKFKEAGIVATSINLSEPADFIGRFEDYLGPGVDCVWLSHVLEHCPNVGATLEHCKKFLNDDGWLVITVPPAKENLVGGHVNLFTMGTLVYNLILAGFGCQWGATHGYNMSVAARVSRLDLPDLTFDKGDIEALRKNFPVKVSQGCSGNLKDWDHLND